MASKRNASVGLNGSDNSAAVFDALQAKRRCAGDGIIIGDVAEETITVEVEGAFPDISTREVLSAYGSAGGCAGADGVGDVSGDAQRPMPSPTRSLHGANLFGEAHEADDEDAMAVVEGCDELAEQLGIKEDAYSLLPGAALLSYGQSDTEEVEVSAEDADAVALLSGEDPLSATLAAASTVNGEGVGAEVAEVAAAALAAALDPIGTGFPDATPEEVENAAATAAMVAAASLASGEGVVLDHADEEEEDPLSSGRSFQAFQQAFQRAFLPVGSDSAAAADGELAGEDEDAEAEEALPDGGEAEEEEALEEDADSEALAAMAAAAEEARHGFAACAGSSPPLAEPNREDSPEDPISEVLPFEEGEEAEAEAEQAQEDAMSINPDDEGDEDIPDPISEVLPMSQDDFEAMPPPMCIPRRGAAAAAAAATGDASLVGAVEDADYPLFPRQDAPRSDDQVSSSSSGGVASTDVGSRPFLDEDEEAEAEGRPPPRAAETNGHHETLMLPPTCSPPPSPPSPPPTPMQGKFLIREGSDRGDVLQFFVSGASFAAAYEVGQKIGEGGFGKVFVATHRVLGLSRAVKRLRKASGRSDSHKNELQALLALDHPHIVKLVEYYDEEHYLYLIFELCHGPDLFDRVTSEEKGRMSEIDASVALRHMLKAIQCCHSKYRGHFDIKPENFMYANSDLNNLKMIDLGMSSGFDLHRRRHKIKGTAAYMAPELWRGTYGPEADIWSCGVVLFVMLTGEPALPNLQPATMKNESKIGDLLRRRMKYAISTFGLSEKAQDLLGLMLQHDRHGRPTVREALKHPFCNLSYESEVSMPLRIEESVHTEANRILSKIPELFRVVAEEPMLKRVARLAMAHLGDPTKAEDLAFRMLDWYGFGELSVSVLERDIRGRGIEPPEELGQLFEAMDLLREGYISYLTFLSVTLPPETRRDENLCQTAFRVLDRDHDGAISTSDLTSVFGNEQVCRGILQEVSFEERMNIDAFLRMMREDVRTSEHPFCWCS